MADEDNNSLNENEELENQQDTDSSMMEEDDLEAQMSATMAAEGLSDSSEEDDLEAQMAAAMDSELGDDSEKDDLEAPMAAAMGGEGDTLDDSLSDDLPEGMDGDSISDIPVQPVEFQQLKPTDEAGERDNVNRLMDVSLSLSVELGRKKMQIREILDLGPGKIIELDKLAGEPVDLLVNGKLLAKGEVVVVDENFGVRITDLISPKDRVKSL